MANASKPSNATVVDKVTQRLKAFKNYVKNSKTEIPIDGVPHKATEVVEIYQTSIDTRAVVATKRAETKAAMSARANAEASRRAADRALKPWVINTFGANSQEAIDFGFPPPKVPARTVDNKAQAVALNLATREARGTKGPKAKLKIKGTIPVPTAPAAPVTNQVQAGPTPASTPVLSSPAVVAQASPPQVNGAPTPSPGASAPTNGAATVTNGASH